MAKLSRKKGITSQIFHVFILDSSSTIGAGLTGLVYNSASLACRYITAGGTLSGAITLQDITTLGTYEAPTANTNMRFKEVSSASPSQGMYEIHVHNDWMNLSGGNLVIMAAGATNMAPLRLEIDLQADVNLTHIQGDATSTTDLKDFADAGYDPATNKVQGVVLVDTTTTNTDMRGTNSAALASVCTETRLAELDAANLIADVAAVKADTAAVLLDTGTDGVVVATASKTGYSLTQSFPANFAALAITAGGLIDITQTAADKVWGTAARTLTSFGTLVADVWAYATRVLTAGTNIALAKGTGVTGFNDLALTDIEATTILAKEATLAHATYGLAALNTDIDAIKAKTDNLPEGFKKNTAFNNFMFLMVDSTDNKTGKTGLTITATRSIDGAAFAACANSAAEVGSGFYKINLATSDQNGDMITYKFDGGATANVRTITIKTSA